MSTTDGARSGGDPVLDGALSEMSGEGSFDATATFDPGSTSASQSTGDASAAPAAAQPAPTGDDGSIKAGSTTATPADPGATDPAADPLAGTEPFTYLVNGETRTLPGVYRVPGEGLLVPEDQVSSLQSLAERAEVLDRATRDITAQHATLERLSSWTVNDSEGKPQTVTGQQGLEAMRVEHARQSSLISVVDQILTDPAKLLSLLAKDEQGNIVVDPTAVETLQMRAQLAADAAEKTARSQFAKLGTPAPSVAASQPSSHANSAPGLIKQAAGTNHDALTADDHAILAKQLDRYVRPVTEEDRRWNPALKLGSPIVDEAYGQVVAHLATQRAASKQTAKAAESAGKHNAGMEKGRQPAKPAPKAPAPPAAPSNDRKPKADWETPLASALAEMGVPR